MLFETYNQDDFDENFHSDLMYENDHKLIKKFSEAYSNGSPKAADPFKDILKRESNMEFTRYLPCPECGAEGMNIYRSTCDDDIHGFWCESCGYERNIKDDILPVINSILYYTIVATPLNARISHLLYDLFTDQIHKMNLDVEEQSQEQEDDEHLSAGPYTELIF